MAFTSVREPIGFINPHVDRAIGVMIVFNPGLAEILAPGEFLRNVGLRIRLRELGRKDVDFLDCRRFREKLGGFCHQGLGDSTR